MSHFFWASFDFPNLIFKIDDEHKNQLAGELKDENVMLSFELVDYVALYLAKAKT